MNVVGWAEHHPYQLAGGIFGVGLIVVLIVTHKSAPAAQQTVSGYDPGYNASVVAANASIQSAQLAAQTHSFDVQSSLRATLDAHATAVTLAGDQTGLMTTQSNNLTTVDIAKIQGDNATAIGLATLGVNGSTQLATTAAAQAIALAGINAGVVDSQGATAFKLAQVAADTSRLGMMAGADLSKFTTQSNNDAALAGLAISSNQATQLATIGGGFDLAKTQIGAGVAMSNIAAGVQTAQINANTTVHGQDAALSGLLAGNALAWHGQDTRLAGIASNDATTMHGQDTSYLLNTQKTNTAFIRDVHQADLDQQLAAYKVVK